MATALAHFGYRMELKESYMHLPRKERPGLWGNWMQRQRNPWVHYVLALHVGKQGHWVVKQKTAGSRFHRAVRRIAVWCRLNRHLPMAVQHRALGLKLRGHFLYYGVIGNLCALRRFRNAVLCTWRKWLSRRHRDGVWSWARLFAWLRLHPLPVPCAWAAPRVANP